MKVIILAQGPGLLHEAFLLPPGQLRTSYLLPLLAQQPVPCMPITVARVLGYDLVLIMCYSGESQKSAIKCETGV